MLASNVMLILLRVFVDLKYCLAEMGNQSSPSIMVLISTFIPAFFMAAWAFNYDQASERAGHYGVPISMIQSYEDLKRTRKAFDKDQKKQKKEAAKKESQ